MGIGVSPVNSRDCQTSGKADHLGFFGYLPECNVRFSAGP